MMYKNGVKAFLWILAGVGLVLTILPPVLVFTGTINFNLHLTLMTIGMVLWFGARIWIQSKENK